MILDRGGMRRVWLRGRENVQKRYLIHVAAYNLGLIMRLLTGAGTPRELILRTGVWLLAYREPNGGLGIIIFVHVGNHAAALVIAIRSDPSS